MITRKPCLIIILVSPLFYPRIIDNRYKQGLSDFVIMAANVSRDFRNTYFIIIIYSDVYNGQFGSREKLRWLFKKE